MGFPLFRFTLSNDIEGSLVISEPGGWDDSKFVLDRHTEFHSLVELYDQPLTFYGEDNENNGGIAYIRNIEQTQGLDAQINILIEISNDQGVTYETAFEGMLNLEPLKETDFYKLETAIDRNDFWSKFINRTGIPIDLQSLVDLDGDARSAVNKITINLTSQKVVQRFERDIHFNDANEGLFPVGTGSGTLNYLIFSNEYSVVDEIEDRVEYGTQVSALLPTDVSKYIYKVEFAGEYQIDANIRAFYVFGASRNYDISWWYVLRENGTLSTPTQIGSSQVGTGTSVEGLSNIILSDTVTLLAGDEIYIYGILTLNTTTSITYFSDYDADLASPFDPVYTQFEVTANTTYPATETDAYLLQSAANSILCRIIGADNVLTSTYLNDPGCASLYSIMRGLHVRGYTFTDKPFTLSFDDWWAGANGILNLGLGYDEILGVSKIRIEKKEYFYNTTTSINFDFVNNIERSYDLNSVYKIIEIGYEKWSAESESGVDDPQTKRWYNTRFKTVGKEIRILSKFIAASLAIEQTRRNRIELGKDWRLDEDILIIALKELSVGYEPELDENFTIVSNLLNPETRYNIRLSVARNFERWRSYFNGCLQWYVGEDYKFARGEGNFDMVSTLDSGDCEYEDSSPEPSVDEKGDIPITGDFLFMPIVYSFEHPMTWEQYKTIRDNRNNAIGISRTDENHISCFIQELEYEITHGKAKFTVVIGENTTLTDDWILQTGTWDDSLFWRDTKLWID